MSGPRARSPALPGAYRPEWARPSHRWPARVLAALVAAVSFACGPSPAAAASAVPRFTLFGWVSPPPDQTTPARYAEMASVGMNVALPAWDDPHDRDENLRRLDLAAAHGMRCFVADERFSTVVALGVDTPEALARIDSIVADYRHHPAFLGYYLGDEPKSDAWPVLQKLFPALRARDPDHPAWNNLAGIRGFGDSALWVADNRGYLERMHPAVLCDAHYDFRIGFDYGEFVMNAAALRAWSLEYGIPFWSIVQLVPHANVRPITQGELAWQVSMLLAYGARGIGYFTYWTPAPDPQVNWGPAIITYDGTRTPWYDVVRQLNLPVRLAGETLATLNWVSTQHAGSVPRGGAPFRGDDWLAAVDGRAAIGRFSDAAGVPYLLVVNADSLAAQDIGLTFVGVTGVSRLETTGAALWQTWRPGSTDPAAIMRLALDPGEFALLRLEGTFSSRVSKLGPTLAVVPSPAAGEVRFDLSRLAGDARIEVLDATGRLIWSREAPAGRASFAWHGERDAGGRARPGIYLACVRDARGAITRRWSWLGGS